MSEAQKSNGAALTVHQRTFNSLRTLLTSDAMKNQLAMALPKHITPDRLVRVALTSINKTPALLDCTQESVLASIIESAQLGLMPDGILGEAYLIPYGNTCQLQPGYRGLINLARRSGEVANIYAELVDASDEFDVTLGLRKDLTHKPLWENLDRLQVTSDCKMPALKGAYAVVIFKDGTADFEYQPLARLNQLRASSKSANSKKSPWQTPLAVPEMYRKCPIRALAKRLPLSPEFQRAAIIDEYVEAGIDPKLVTEHIDRNSDLARNATESALSTLRDKYLSAPEDETQEAGPTQEEVAQDPQSTLAQSAQAPASEAELRAAQEKLEKQRKSGTDTGTQGVQLEGKF